MSVNVSEELQSRLTKVSRLLISQPSPADENSPYHVLAKKYHLKIDFKPFIEIEGTSIKDFRKQKVNLLDHTAVIFTSRNAVDNFFRIAAEIKIELPIDMKYFCVTEQTANYLQKYITIRKRKVFVGQKKASDLFDIFKKHKGEKFLYPCSDVRQNDIPDYLKSINSNYTEAVFYRTVSTDMSAFKLNHDIIAFFSPSGIESLKVNFPDFQQNGTRIAAFGPTTAKAVREAGFILDIEAPLPNAPSMTGALDDYIAKCNKTK